jgi:pimeloyl-ACP methyl ester carboxylesterase
VTFSPSQQAPALSSTVQSSDGTTIAFDRSGDGPPIILVVGAFNLRSTGEPLARFLAAHFTAFTYDRRGRGESGDTAPYAIEREVEDLDALIVEAGGSASVFGYSSGALLALKAAARGLAITRLALYEPPFVVLDGRPGPAVDHARLLAELIAADRRADAVEYFQREIVGIPAEIVAQLRNAPFRPALEALAPSLVYDATIVTDRSLPAELASVTVPTLVIDGGNSPAELRTAAHALANGLPDPQHRSLAGQTHDLVPEAVGPVLSEFFAG